MVRLERYNPAKLRSDGEMGRFLLDQTRLGTYARSRTPSDAPPAHAA